jgi:hypothetical protein
MGVIGLTPKRAHSQQLIHVQAPGVQYLIEVPVGINRRGIRFGVTKHGLADRDVLVVSFAHVLGLSRKRCQPKRSPSVASPLIATGLTKLAFMFCPHDGCLPLRVGEAVRGLLPQLVQSCRKSLAHRDRSFAGVGLGTLDNLSLAKYLLLAPKLDCYSLHRKPGEVIGSFRDLFLPGTLAQPGCSGRYNLAPTRPVPVIRRTDCRSPGVSCCSCPWPHLFDLLGQLT